MSLVPDYYFDDYKAIRPEFLYDIGIRGVVLDVDNTLEPYEHPQPGEEVIVWLSELSRLGIRASIVSNNNGERINLFNESLGLPAYFKAGKPFKKNVLLAMGDMGTDKDSTLLIGDQIFTDVWAARNAGIRAILVKPIKDKTDIFTKFKRFLEKPIIKRYIKKKRGV